MNAQIKGGWMENTNNLKASLSITNNTKQHIKEQTRKYFKQKTETDAGNKTKKYNSYSEESSIPGYQEREKNT